jgi:predicted kinase
MCDQPLFESLEGLRGTGKTTLAPLLAAARGAVLVPTVPPYYQPLRQEIDRRCNVEARLCFYLSALFMATDEIQRHLSDGTRVVVESYFARCLASHQALGARTGITLPPGLPRLTAYQLVCDEKERRRRLAAREQPVSRWDVLVERAAEPMASAYSRFHPLQVDTTHRTPEQVIRTILSLAEEGAC